MTFQKVIYDSIEVFERQRMMSPKQIVVGRLLAKKIAQEIDPRATEVLVVCGLIVEVDEEMEPMSFAMF